MRHFLNNILVSPRNVLDIGLITDNKGNPGILQINTDNIVLPREARDIILSHVATQGVFEGIPYRIELDNGIKLEYYVDLTAGTVYNDFDIEVQIKKRKGYDNFNENAQGLSFELMNKKGVVFNLIDIPYLIIPPNQAELGISLSIATYVLTKESIQATKDLITVTRDLVEALTPNISLVPVPPLGEIISLSLAVAGQLAYTIAVYIALIKMARQMFELIFPKVRYYKGSTIKDLIEKGCSYLGYTLNSNLLNSMDKLTLMPVPLIKQKKGIFDYIQNDLNFSFTKGYPTAQDSISTLGELIGAVELWFNAKTRVNNGVVEIERRDYWQNISSNTTLPALNVQDERQNSYVLNTEEAWKRTYIHYQVDYSDTHTLDFFDPTDAEFSTEPLNVINNDLINIRGLNDINIPFALGVRKDKLNFLEKLAKKTFSLVDKITGIFGNGTGFGTAIGNRVGVTQISQQYYSVTKVLYAVNGSQTSDYISKIKASKIYDDYHKINEITVNSYKIYNEVPLRMKSSEFQSLINNNFAYINGILCEILSISFIDEKSTSVISYKEPFNYAQGTVSIITIND